MVVFTDGRSKRVIFLAHCLLNQNAISDGTAVSPASFQAVIRLLLDAEVGIVQMPCPELCCLGLDRGNIHGADSPVTVENTRIRESLGQDGPRRQLEALAGQVAHQILEYRKYGFAVLGIIGADRSPTCGVETTSDQGVELPGRGVFMGALCRALERRGISLPCVGVKAGPQAAARVKALLEGQME